MRRKPVRADERQATWDPEANQIDLGGAGPFEAVVHLAGENIAQRWTPAAKTRIRDSRVRGTRLLCDALAALPTPPRVLLCASATGYYGDRGEEWLDEDSVPGDGFLAEVCRDWEAAMTPISRLGCRVVWLRLGVVLSLHGGAFAKMLPAFRFGLGGRFGHGRQYWSWITLDDLLSAILRALTDESMTGPINAVSPHPVTNREFTAALGAALRRPALLPVPALAVRLLLGEMGEAALLASARVRPARLEKGGFVFQFPELGAALRHLLSAGR